LNSTSFPLLGSIWENATFYPGLKIVTGTDGAVSYSYGIQVGTVGGGTTQTIYAHLGTSISLSANPSSILYEFTGWAATGSGTQNGINVVINSPQVLEANFSYNYVVLGAIGIGLVAIVAVVVQYLWPLRPTARSEHLDLVARVPTQ
jgi:hypothetical protein